MTRRALFAVLSLFLFALGLVAAPDSHKQDWTNYVRIGAYGLKGGDAQHIVERAQASAVFGLEVDNDLEGRYASFVRPEAKMKAIPAVAAAAHKVANHALVY